MEERLAFSADSRHPEGGTNFVTKDFQKKKNFLNNPATSSDKVPSNGTNPSMHIA
jgi:hypothetical protein